MDSLDTDTDTDLYIYLPIYISLSIYLGTKYPGTDTGQIYG